MLLESLALVTAGSVGKALQTGHHTFSTFTKPACTGLRRWQQWMVVVTLLVGGLTVDIWRAPPPPPPEV